MPLFANPFRNNTEKNERSTLLKSEHKESIRLLSFRTCRLILAGAASGAGLLLTIMLVTASNRYDNRDEDDPSQWPECAKDPVLKDCVDGIADYFDGIFAAALILGISGVSLFILEIWMCTMQRCRDNQARQTGIQSVNEQMQRQEVRL